MPITPHTKSICLALIAMGMIAATGSYAEEPMEIETDLVVRGTIRRPQVFFLVPKANLSPIAKDAIRQDAVAEIIGLAATARVTAPERDGAGLFGKSIVQALRDKPE